AGDVQMSEGMPTGPGYARSTGTVRALTRMIDFSDAVGEGDALDRYREFFPSTQEWFRTSSYGRLDYRSDIPIPDWLRMPKSFRAYGIERGAPFDPGYRRLVRDIVEAADPRVDFRAYDMVNVLVTPNAGPSALDTVLSVTFAGNTEAPTADGVPVANASFVYSRQDDGSGSYESTGYRVLPHENGHVFGLPDLYTAEGGGAVGHTEGAPAAAVPLANASFVRSRQADGSGSYESTGYRVLPHGNGHVFGLPDLYTAEGGGAVGHWDIMSEDWGANNDLLAWHKWKLGWLDTDQVHCAAAPGTRDYTLTPLADTGGPKLAFLPLDEQSGYAVEVRTQAGNDEAVCRPGVLIYKVDANVDTGMGPITVYDSRRDSGGCTRSPNVHAELSDAPFTPGESFVDRHEGIRITVLEATGADNADAADDSGSSTPTYRIRVTRD